MSTLFLLFLFFLCLLRMPLSLLPILLKNIHPFFKTRLDFERKNLTDEGCRSFGLDEMKAHVCFEVSSEGELEQVRPLIEETIKAKKLLEILFSSPSVEGKIEKLYKDHPAQVRYFRLPLMTFWPVSFLYFQNFWQWTTAPVVLMCRYDFFPELLVMKLFKKRFILLSAASKKMNLYKRLSFGLFDLIVAATKLEADWFKSNVDVPVIHCDLRIPRIAARSENAALTLAQLNETNLNHYLEYVKTIPLSKKLIIGSCWSSDLKIFADIDFREAILSGNFHISLAPHKIDLQSINDLKNELEQLFSRETVGLLSESFLSFPIITIIDKSGILCELYNYFPVAYVGGGYERSIHSVLEPFISGAKVLCGPKIHRSTEFDLVAGVAANEIHVLKNPESFYNQLRTMLNESPDLDVRKTLIAETVDSKQMVLSAIH